MIRQSFHDDQIDVIVPSYRRPESLERCMRALAVQSHLPAAIIVVVRIDDDESRNLLATIAGDFPALVIVEVAEPGAIAAMSAGASRSSSPIIAFTDDDACPRPDWLARIAEHFLDSGIGGVGGRDVIVGQEHARTEKVGRFSRSGKLVGNHHLGSGGARTVHVLKGVNMAFRAEALALPAAGVLRGDGAQVDWEVLTCAWARLQGWRLVYDPEVVVDHDGAPRRGADQRVRPEGRAVIDAAYNSVIAPAVLDRHLPIRRVLYPIVVGTRDRPGLFRAAVAAVRVEPEVLRRAPPALRGRLVAMWALAGQRLPRQGSVVVTAEVLRAGPLSQPLPVVALVAHDIHDHGGMERACAQLILRARDEVDFVVVAAALAPELRTLVKRWVRVRVPPRPFPAKFFSFFVLGGLVVRSLDVDLVHTVGAIVPNRVDVATVQFCHAGYRSATDRLAPVDARLLRRVNTGIARLGALVAERWSYRSNRVGVLAAVSVGVARELETHYPGVPVALTPNGIDPNRFYPDANERRGTRTSFGVSAGQCVALFVGGDWDRKGLAVAIEALARVRADGVDAVLWVVGAGNETHFSALARGLGVEDWVRFFGRRGDTERFYRGADLFVLPSAYETFSLVCFEAAACGLPLVIPPLSGAGELVGEAEGGVIIDREVGSVAAALGALARDPARRTELGAEAHRRASRFTWEASAASVIKVYRARLDSRLPAKPQ